MKIIDFLKAESENLELPENYFRGLCLPERFALPDSILLFFSRWGVRDEYIHGRYQLVVPFSPVIYCVEKSRYELTSGMGLLLSPWQKHSHLHCSENILCERLLVTFELPSSQSYLPDSPLFALSDKAMEYLEMLLEDYRSRRMPELSWGLTMLLKELSGKTIPVAEQSLSELTAGALALINKNIRTVLDIPSVADQLRISASHLRMVFRRDMGISIGKYIAEQRLHLACVLLQNQHLSIQAIAENCGFASLCAFSHFFKKEMGVSPALFRRKES